MANSCFYCLEKLTRDNCTDCCIANDLDYVITYNYTTNIRGAVNGRHYFTYYYFATNITRLVGDFDIPFIWKEITGHIFTPSNFKKRLTTYLIFQ